MELKLLQSQVQTNGTITAFNYAYCRILHDQAIEHLKTDIVNGNGDIFCLDENAVNNLKELSDERELEDEIFDNFNTSDEETAAHRLTINKTQFRLKEDSPLEIIFDQLDEQLNDDWNMSGVGSMCDNGGDFVKKTFAYLDKVNNFLAMFESEQ